MDSAMLADIGGLLLLPFGLIAIGFWIWTIVDCARNETGGSLIAWLLLILFAGLIAAPLYFLLRRLPRRRLARFRPELLLYQPWPKNRRVE